MTSTGTKLPYLHRNSRSSRITSEEIREVYTEEITRGLPGNVNRDQYLDAVMP